MTLPPAISGAAPLICPCLSHRRQTLLSSRTDKIEYAITPQWCYPVVGDSIRLFPATDSPTSHPPLPPPSSPPCCFQPPFAGQSVARLRFSHPHHPVALLCRRRLRQSTLSHSPFRLLTVASPRIHRRQVPSPLSLFSLLMHSPPSCSLLLSRLPPATLLPCSAPPGILLRLFCWGHSEEPLVAHIAHGAKRQRSVEIARKNR